MKQEEEEASADKSEIVYDKGNITKRLRNPHKAKRALPSSVNLPKKEL